MVWVIIDHDLVTLPNPVAAKADIGWGDAEIEAAKPKAARTAALNPKDVARAKTATEMPMLPRVVHTEVGIIAARFMSYPFAVGVNVRNIRMSRLVVERVIL